MILFPQVVTPPARYPVSRDEVRAQLGIEHDENDPRLQGLIAAATELAEAYTNRAFINRTLRGSLHCFPACGYIDLPRLPLVSVTSISGYDADDVATVLDDADYIVTAGDWRGRVTLRSGASWPTVDRAADGAEIVWVAGYGENPADVPEAVRLGIIVLIGWLNENRGDETDPQAIPLAAKALLDGVAVLTV